MDETLADFRESGADLPDEGKRRLEALEGELASITQTFSENVLDAMNQYELLIDDPARLDGLPESARAAALALARAKGLGTPTLPVWRFTLHMPSYLPVMKFSADEPLRRTLWEAMGAVGKGDAPWRGALPRPHPQPPHGPSGRGGVGLHQPPARAGEGRVRRRCRRAGRV
ncbi:MAG: hypothetical protein IPI35_05990 [Deltaproteobacteria bacterium]|nr:hypothetical protein [Deltaproteobacteria bacterium]